MGDKVRVAAVDLGATSGRVLVGTVGPGELSLVEVHRFPNGAVERDGRLRWGVERLYEEVLVGLRQAANTGSVDSIGIDTWAIDFGLLDAGGDLIAPPYSHRDSRVEGVMERVMAKVGSRRMYETTGLQQLPFNTIYQLVSDAAAGELDGASTLLLIPDLVAYWLTGEKGAERTNASTTQLYDVRRREWATELAQRVGVPIGLLPPLRSPGELIGMLLPEVVKEVGCSAPVIAVGSHDTASAVAAVPAEGTRFAYISSGTWSLVGLELEEPVLNAAAEVANFTNEAGVDGTIRFLKNVSGLWVVNECARAWGVPVPELVASAARLPGGVLIDVEHPSLIAPSSETDPMPDRVRRLTDPHTARLLEDPGAMVRYILESLASAYALNLQTAIDVAEQPVDIVHVVGGGAQNELLCQLTADACGLPVLAGPTEAAALGNILVQARALASMGTGLDEDLSDLAAMRALVRATQTVRRYEPSEH